MNNQQDIMSVCLAVVRGVLTPEQAREAILGRTAPQSMGEILHLKPELTRDAAELGRLPPRERDECLDLFKDLYSQAPVDSIRREDEDLARLLVEHRLISQSQAEECIQIQGQLLEKGLRPLPRLAELLIKMGYLVPGGSEDAITVTLGTGADAGLADFPVPPAVQDACSQPGNRFGRYVRTSLLGRGGAGEIWKAWDLELGRWVALKFLKFEDTEELARLKREAQTAARLSHPGIARVFEIIEVRDRTFIALEYIEGQSLETVPRHDHRKLATYVREAALAIHYAHGKGIIHRDLKPGNMMVDPSDRVFVMDFGLARQIESKRSITGQIVGTPSYMSPEQATGRVVDIRSDVYSLGATLYELLADRPPFSGKTVFDTLEKVVTRDPDPLPRISGDLATIVLKCLMKEPSRRYATAADLAEDLRRWLEGEPILAHPPSTLYRLRKKVVKWRAILGVGLAGLLAACGTAAWVVPRWLRADRADSLKGLELASEKAERARTEHALALARPHLDEGRRLEARLDRLLTSETWTAQDVRSLVDQAQKEFDLVLQIFPNHPDALLEKARIFQYENNLAAAVEYCTKAIDSTHEYATARLQRARLWLDQYEGLRDASERHVRPENGQGRSLAERITADLQEVLAWSGDPREITFANGALAFVDGKYETAARLLEEYSKLTLSDYRGWEWTAHAWLHVPGMEPRAVLALTEAMKYRPRLPSLFVFRGRAKLQSSILVKRRLDLEKAAGLRAQAIEDFRSAREIDPMEPAAHRGLGDAFLEAGDGSLAASHFTQALALDPRYSSALVGRARARLRNGDFAGARADAEEALRLGSLDPMALVVRGRARCAQQDFGGAMDDLTRARVGDPRDPEALLGLGDLQREQGDAAGAIENYDRALAIDPASAESLHRRGNARRDRGEDALATADLNRALVLDPANPWIYYDRGICACNRFDWTEAVDDFRKGLARMPSDAAPFWLRLWLARTRLGEPEAAREELAMLSADTTAADPNSLASKIILLLLGKLPMERFLQDLASAPRSRAELARGRFYVAEKALLEGDRRKAERWFHECLQLQAGSTAAHSTAAAELRGPPVHR